MAKKKKKSRSSKKTVDRFDRIKRAKEKLEAGGKRYVKAADVIAFFHSIDDGLQSVLDDVVDDLELEAGVDRVAAKEALSPARQDLRALIDKANAKIRERAFDPHEAN